MSLRTERGRRTQLLPDRAVCHDAGLDLCIKFYIGANARHVFRRACRYQCEGPDTAQLFPGVSSQPRPNEDNARLTPQVGGGEISVALIKDSKAVDTTKRMDRNRIFLKSSRRNMSHDITNFNGFTQTGFNEDSTNHESRAHDQSAQYVLRHSARFRVPEGSDNVRSRKGIHPHTPSTSTGMWGTFRAFVRQRRRVPGPARHAAPLSRCRHHPMWKPCVGRARAASYHSTEYAWR